MPLIAVVDDDFPFRSLMKEIFETDGYAVKDFSNGREFLSFVRSTENPLPDIVLLDVMMPEMDGYTVYTELKKDDRSKDLPIVIITAKGHPHSVFESSLKLIAFLEKPVDVEALKQLVAKTVAAKRR